MESVQELQEIEAEAVRRFKTKADELRRADPTLTAQIAFARAVTQLPRTADRYHYARQRLGFMGIPGLPLR